MWKIGQSMPIVAETEQIADRRKRLSQSDTIPYPLVPATLVGRLAVDRRFQGRGYGRFLLADALLRALRSEIASFAVVVDAKDDAVRRSYERESFLQLLDEPMKLFRPISDIAKLFES